jgi:peptide/nickel transport system ATP-binding protein
MAELRRELGVSFMFISHDISTVRAICDDIAVLYAGRKVEAGSRAAFRSPPFHPYTDLLIASVPEMRRGWLEETPAREARSRMAPASHSDQLCGFLERCPLRIAGVCDVTAPPLVRLAQGAEVLCHRSEGDLAAARSRRSAGAA